jgi:hypothetical protein
VYTKEGSADWRKAGTDRAFSFGHVSNDTVMAARVGETSVTAAISDWVLSRLLLLILRLGLELLVKLLLLLPLPTLLLVRSKECSDTMSSAMKF